MAALLVEFVWSLIIPDFWLDQIHVCFVHVLPFSVLKEQFDILEDTKGFFFLWESGMRILI